MKAPKFLTGLLLGTILAAAIWYWQKSTSAEDGALEVLDRLAVAEARLQAMREQMEASPGETSVPEAAAPPVDDLQQIDGIGPTYARRLREAGIITVADLAAADPQQVQQLSAARSLDAAAAWIAAAQELGAS